MLIISNKTTDECQSIDLSEQCIAAKRTEYQSSEVYRYYDIEECEVVLTADEYYHKGSAYTTLQSMEIIIKTAKGDYFSINTDCNYSKLFEILNYKRNFKKFKLYAEGPKDAIDIPIKIYSKFGIKLPIKDSDRVFNLEMMAAVFLLMPLFIEVPIIPYSYMDFWFIMILEFIALILISISIYQEFIKHKIRKLLNL